jgi:hypothetical protein
VLAGSDFCFLFTRFLSCQSIFLRQEQECVLIFPTVIFCARVFGLQSPACGGHQCSSVPHWGLAHFSTESSTGAGIFHPCFFCSRLSPALKSACLGSIFLAAHVGYIFTPDRLNRVRVSLSLNVLIGGVPCVTGQWAPVDSAYISRHVNRGSSVSPTPHSVWY